MNDLIPMETPHANTCTICGQPLGEVCWATDVQAAIAGLAWCESCAAPEPEQEPEHEPARPKRRSTRAK